MHENLAAKELNVKVPDHIESIDYRPGHVGYQELYLSLLSPVYIIQVQVPTTLPSKKI